VLQLQVSIFYCYLTIYNLLKCLNNISLPVFYVCHTIPAQNSFLTQVSVHRLGENIMQLSQ